MADVYIDIPGVDILVSSGLTTSVDSGSLGGGGGSPLTSSVLTDYRTYVAGYDFSRKAEWEISVEENLGSADTASFKLQDRFGWSGGNPGNPLPFADVNAGAGFEFDKSDVLIEIDGQEVPLFRGFVNSAGADLPVQFPWPRYDFNCTGWEEEIFSRRLVGYPDGYIWGSSSPSEDPSPLDPYSEPRALRLYYQDLVVIPTFGAIDVTTFCPNVSGYNGQFDSTDIRGVTEAYAGIQEGNIAYWVDTLHRLHFVTVPRWFEAPADPLLERAPVDLDADTPNGTTTMGFRNLKWHFDYNNGGGTNAQYYVSGGLGFDYGGGAVKFNGTGWENDGIPVDLPPGRSAVRSQYTVSDDGSIDAAGRAAAGRRMRKMFEHGVLHGSLTFGNERHHIDGFHKGQLINISDARWPANLNGRDYIIQRVRTKLLPTINWRIYEIEFGDAPLGRSSTRRKPAGLNADGTTSTKALPGRLWDIASRIMHPSPGSTVTVVGQLVDDAGQARRIGNLTVCLALLIWSPGLDPHSDAPDTAAGDIGASMSAGSVISDKNGRWQVDVTFGPTAGYSYEVVPVEC